MEDSKPRILNQDKSYRRGLVLGLTMAEIMVLILFALLLILSSTYGVLKKEIQGQQELIRAKESRIAELVALDKILGDILRQNPDGVTVADIVQEIKRQQGNITLLNAEIERLKALATNSEAIETIIREISRHKGENANSQSIAEELTKAADLLKENETLKGQNAQLSRQIKVSGRGNEFPSCWVTRDGKVESIYELVMGENGITINDRPLPHRAIDKAQLPISSVPYNVELSSFEFQLHLRPLYEWSIAHNCRFYVILASSELSAPIHLVNVANGFFYPDSRIQYRPAN